VHAEQAVCLLDLPLHWTGTVITKPVDPIVGQVIEAWQAERPTQPKRLDRKTVDHVDLSSPSVRNLAKRYISRTLIPTLCAMAGVPTADVWATSQATELDHRQPRGRVLLNGPRGFVCGADSD
jgi:hypothetical protein